MQILKCYIKYNKSGKIDGFTLVETLVYTALFGLVLSSFISFCLLVIGLKQKSIAIEEVNANLREAQNFLTQNIEEAARIISPGIGQSGDILVLETKDNIRNTFKTENGILTISTDNGQSQKITGSQVSVKSINYTNMSDKPENEILKIELDLQYNGGSPESEYEDNFSTAVCVR